jgi:hypothetical protein|tara:strand:- start:479 stop:706 length:228 start_codon:yes stop_codon:yes gene_type:complete
MDKLIYERGCSTNGSGEPSKIVLELSEDLTLNEFRISCIRLANTLGYTDNSIQKLFGKIDSNVKKNSKQVELLHG